MTITTGENAWRKVEGVMGDKRILRKKGNMLSSCVTSAYTNVLETLALTEKQQEKVQVCETNLVRRILGIKKADKRRMGELRVEVEVK